MTLKRVYGLIIILFMILPQFHVLATENRDYDFEKDQTTDSIDIIEERYHTVLEKWENNGVKDASAFEASVSPDEFINVDLLPIEKSNGYGDAVFHLNKENPSFSFEIQVPESGLYEIIVDYYPISHDVPIEASIKINDEYQYYESRRIVFPLLWRNAKDEYEKDRFGNELIPEQVPQHEWRTISVEDASHMYPRPLKFYLSEGKNTITFNHLRGEMLVGNVYVSSPIEIPSYEEYKKRFPERELVKDLITIEAEKGFTKNTSYIRPISVVDSSVVPNDSKNLLLNAVGGESWKESGTTINWKVTVKKSGFYKLTIKTKQTKEGGGTVFRTLLIDHEIPFKEVMQIPFQYEKSWENVTLADEEGEPFLFYLTEGEHTISLKADASPLERTINAITEVTMDMQDFALSIKKLTGNQTDDYRDWDIKEFFPDIEERFDAWIEKLQKESKYLKDLYRGSDAQEIASLELAVEKLETLKKEPNKIPNRLTELTEGSSSVAQLLTNLLIQLPEQPLVIDRFYLYGDVHVPDEKSSIFQSFIFNIKRFIHSFSSGNYAVGETKKDTLEVWVNRPRQYVELLQNLADHTFTQETGIKVHFSVMPNEQKLILAAAGNEQPDVAIGVSNWLPYELAIRGALVDLRQFEDFHYYIKQFSPGAFLPFIIDDSVYALPETQDFYVQFYRKDILEELDIPVPETWDEVLQILPELQRFGMNYYTPIAGAGSFKPFHTTVPFIYQFGGELYTSDGMKTAIDSEQSLEAIEFMTELNTIYSMPLQVPNFYNHFRYGQLPIGISNFTTYVQLTTAAPEISGWWDIAPHPGIVQNDGIISRWAPGSAQAAMIFKGGKNKEAAWEFLKWWMSTETQTEFANNLQLIYGTEYMWNTANVEAFKNLPWPEEHKETILAQWEFLKEVPKTPGSYMLEREISNIWNKIVFDGENPREAIDESVIAVNRELARKMEEFGYVKNGKMVKPYRIPTLEQIEDWEGENDEH